jgi:hypothetical protein
MFAFAEKDDEKTEWVDKTMGEFQPSNRYYFPVQVWQYADTDTLEEFEMAEVLAEHYILKGHDMLHVYSEYAKKNQEVDYLAKHAGNLAQQ